MLNSVKFLMAALCVALFSLSSKASAVTVDVNQIHTMPTGASSQPDGLMVQTFTATTSGALSQLDLQLYSNFQALNLNSGALISIVSNTGLVPDIDWNGVTGELTMNTLGAVTFAAGTSELSGFDAFFGAFVSFDFSMQGVLLNAGTRYSIVVQQTDDLFGDLLWAHQSVRQEGVSGRTGPYADGDFGSLIFADQGPSAPTLSDGADYGFRTFVEPAVVPLPASLPLLILALGIARTARRVGRARLPKLALPTVSD